MTAFEPKPQQSLSPEQQISLASEIKQWARDLGFDDVGITDIELHEHEVHLTNWVAKGMHGEMDYMHKHGDKRTQPHKLVEGTKRVISVRMDYAPKDIQQAALILETEDFFAHAKWLL